jgi:uncharacterized membrane protein
MTSAIVQNCKRTAISATQKMLKSILICGLPLALAFAIATPADAKGGGGRGFSSSSFAGKGPSSKSFSPSPVTSRPIIVGKVHEKRHWRGYYGPGVIVAGAALYATSDSCYWLKARARATGSEYWWNRYYACIE